MTLNEIVENCDFEIEQVDKDVYRIYDTQLGEYILNSTTEDYFFKSKYGIVDRLEGYLDNEYFSDAYNDLLELGIQPKNATWETIYNLVVANNSRFAEPFTKNALEILDCLAHLDKISSIV